MKTKVPKAHEMHTAALGRPGFKPGISWGSLGPKTVSLVFLTQW